MGIQRNGDRLCKLQCLKDFMDVQDLPGLRMKKTPGGSFAIID